MERKEAIEVIKKNWPDSSFTMLREALETLIPEFKESEDERIRKTLVDYFKTYKEQEECGVKTFFGIPTDNILAWLEKQGEHAKFCDSIQVGDKVTRNQDGVLINLSQLKRVAKKDEKQGEQPKKHDVCDNCDQQGSCVSPCPMKLVEQKPTDKVEPKFKIEKGKWYVCTQTFVLRGKIVVIKGLTYQTEKDNVIKGEDGCLFIDRHDGKASEYFRLWTIQDAKDGDVLASELCDSIILFKGINDDNNIDFYCDYDFSKIDVPGDRFAINNGQHYGNVEDSKDFHPATKEQRDILMKAMADAGYAFDFKKLELKKIVVPIFNIGDTIVEKDLDECSYGTIKDIKDGQYIFTDGSGINIDEQGGWQLKTSTSIERKPTDWSDEDEKMLNQIVSIIEDADLVRPENISIYTNWLKSLKPKYQWKPTIRQLTALEYAVNDNTLSCDELYTLNELYEQLKKL